jgi:hypothetical protein
MDEIKEAVEGEEEFEDETIEEPKAEEDEMEEVEDIPVPMPAPRLPTHKVLPRVRTPQIPAQMPLQSNIPIQPYYQQSYPSQAEIEAQRAEEIRQINMAIDRLQNNGIFRAELIAQLAQLNNHLGRIVSSLHVLAGGN